MFGETAWGNQYAYRTTQSGALAPEARLVAKGRLGEPTEFGRNAQIVEGDDGVIVDHNVEHANLADAPQPGSGPDTASSTTT